MSKYLWWLAAIIICVMIFSFSSETADDSTETSTGFSRLIINLLPFTADMPEAEKDLLAQELDGVVRTLAHFSIYAALGFFLLGALRRTFDHNTMLIAIAFCVLYAISDEVHQLFVGGRSGQISDVVTDSLGSLAGTLVYISSAWIIKKKLQKNEL